MKCLLYTDITDYDMEVDKMWETENVLIINALVRIPYADLSFRFTRSSGPGGQHTNKNETAVELLFDLARTPYLTELERSLACKRLGSYLDGDGVLHLESQSERSQLRNREEVTARFVQLMRLALVPVKHRRPTRPSRSAHERRLTQKRRVGQVKDLRKRPTPGD
jgi:ribosome-associated protein